MGVLQGRKVIVRVSTERNLWAGMDLCTINCADHWPYNYQISMIFLNKTTTFGFEYPLGDLQIVCTSNIDNQLLMALVF